MPSFSRRQPRQQNGLSPRKIEPLPSVPETASATQRANKPTSSRSSGIGKRLSNQENQPAPSSSAEKQKQAKDQYVRRVLADADAFCKPLQYLPDSFLDDTLDDDSFSAEGGELERASGDERLNKSRQPQYLTLKRVSPLPEIANGLRASKNQPSPPPPKRERKASKERRPVKDPKPEPQISSTPVPSSKPAKPTKESTTPIPPVNMPPPAPVETKPSSNPVPKRPMRRIPRTPWVTASITSGDLRPRVAAITPQNAKKPASVNDKVASWRFILSSLRVPSGGVADTTGSASRGLSGVLIAPGTPKKPTKHSEMGTLTSPPRVTDSGVQWGPGRSVCAYTQVSPRIHVSAVTNTSPPRLILEQASVCVDTSSLSPGLPTNGAIGIDSCSVDECMDKVLVHNQASSERLVRG